MERRHALALLPIGTIMEFLGIATLITNEGMLIPKIDLGFSVPAILPADIQGMALFIAGGLTTLYAVTKLK